MSASKAAPGATDSLARDLRAVFTRWPEIAAAYVFGSVPRGEAGPESDLDVGLVFTKRGDSMADHVPLLGEMTGEISRRTGFERVDLIALEPQGPIFCHRILCEGRLIYEADRDRRVDFESETMVRAFDFLPTFHLATAGKARALRRWLRESYDLR